MSEHTVIKNKIDKLGVEVSRLGFGMMRLPTLENGKIDRAESFKLVDKAYKAGVNYFDTAYGYHSRESQDFIGEALAAYPRDSFYIATKFPIWICEDKDFTSVEDVFTQQIKNCHMDYIDFYLIHAMDGERYDIMVKNKVYEFLAEQKKKGKIKFLGFSFHGDYDTFVKLLDNFEWDFVQIQINYVDYKMIESEKLYKQLCDRNIPTVVMEPVRGGFLATPPQPVLEELAKSDMDISPAAWALRWCMDKSNMKVILSGMSSMEQVEDNINTFSNMPEKLSPQEAAMLDTCRDIILNLKTVPCTACGYCMECPFGVNIPGVFRQYNFYKMFANEVRARADYSHFIKENHDASQCTKCGACSPMCPQNIKIPETLEEVHSTLSALFK